MAAVLLVLGAGTWVMVGLTPQTEQVRVGAEAPEYEVVDLGRGDTVALRSSYRGSVTLINVWATYCIPCRSEMPAMQRVYDSLASRGFRIAAVSLDVTGPEAVRRFAQEYHLTFDLLQDQTGTIQQAFQFTGVPASFLLDRRGVIRKLVRGPHVWDSPADRALIEQLLDAPAS